ncbi:hypothetical protein [Vagococcus zengguangii]|uniref:Uncharacterized protein n=1 Tax=Vagococcus zengguangii TaxID=2571750 RepID=A0A4D7CWD5_9ENTE|nr:hypothetical protein [Vagococcus zengguangii]QCI86617.1 hypothetical protein FA707_06370 [Vagococcus zengguangii]TLG79747.1 hypothetical protein FE258_07750 [Vagococcus zengguangii]
MNHSIIELYLSMNDLDKDELLVLMNLTDDELDRYDTLSFFDLPVKLIHGLAVLSNRQIGDVMNELEMMYFSQDKLRGFGFLLQRHNVSFPDLEFALYTNIQEAEDLGIAVLPFIPNLIKHRDLTITEAIEKEMEQAIKLLNAKINATGVNYLDEFDKTDFDPND